MFKIDKQFDKDTKPFLGNEFILGIPDQYTSTKIRENRCQGAFLARVYPRKWGLGRGGMRPP